MALTELQLGACAVSFLSGVMEVSSVTSLYVVAFQIWCDSSTGSLGAWQDEDMPCLPKGGEEI